MSWLRVAAAIASLILLSCDQDLVAIIYVGDSALVGRPGQTHIHDVARLHGCDYAVNGIGGLPTIFWLDPNKSWMRRFVELVHGFHADGKLVNVHLTMGTVDRWFYGQSAHQVARNLERMADFMTEAGADFVYFVTYNDIDGAGPRFTLQDFVDLIDFDSRPRFTLVDLRDLDDIIQGVDDFHYSLLEAMTRAGAVHARTLTIPCNGGLLP